MKGLDDFPESAAGSRERSGETLSKRARSEDVGEGDPNATATFTHAIDEEVEHSAAARTSRGTTSPGQGGLNDVQKAVNAADQALMEKSFALAKDMSEADLMRVIRDLTTMAEAHSHEPGEDRGEDDMDHQRFEAQRAALTYLNVEMRNRRG
jgi:hypothetical protein